MPTAPTRDGDEFVGWYWDENEWTQPLTTLSLLEVTLSNDMVVYVFARWTSDDDNGYNDDDLPIGRPHIPIDGEERFDAGCLSLVDTSGWALRSTSQLSGELRISIFDGGFGRAWIDEMAMLFEERHPGVTVRVLPKSGAIFHNDMYAEIRGVAGMTPSDIYIAHNIPWQQFAGQGLIANMDNLFDSAVYYDTNNNNAPVTVSDRIAQDAFRTAKMRDRDGNVGHWQIPFTMGVSGIAYNADMFRIHGWQAPETVDDLFRLAETIAFSGERYFILDAGGMQGGLIRPFVWSQEREYLWDSVVFDWWAQLAGLESELPTSIMRFNRYETVNQFHPELWSELKTAWTKWYNLIALRPTNWYAGSMALSNREAQGHFAQWRAAMIPATSSLANELYMAGFTGNFRMMPTPIIDGARVDANGNPIRVSSAIEYNQNIVIAENGRNRAVAEEFLRFMMEREISLTFPANTSGALLAHRYNFVELYSNATTEWERSIYEIIKNSYRFSTWSCNPMYTMTNAGVWPNNHRYVSAATNPHAFTPESFFNQRWNMARNDWNRWLRDAGVL